MLIARIDKFSHFFMVTKIHPSFFPVIKRCLDELIQIQYVKIRGRVQKQATKVFAASNKQRTEFRFHINYFDRFSAIMKDLNHGAGVEIYEHELYEPKKPAKPLKLPEEIVMRDYQVNSIDYCLRGGRSKLITLQMGLGKTITALKFGEIYNRRIFIVVLARYTEQWKSEIYRNYGKKINLHLAKGGADFYRLLDLAKQEYELKIPLKKSKFPDVVLVSSNTFQRFLTSWEQATSEEREEMICPHEIFEYMGTGLKILDEAHQHFHLNFKMDLYQHMPKAVYLTATLESNDSFMQRMYQLMWPLDTRDQVLAFRKYDIIHPIFYRHHQPERIRCVGGQGYSHVLYEQSIKRHKPSRRQYLDMVGDVVEDYFLPVYAKGRKMLIFCSLVETCELVSEYLLKRFKDQKWQISRFVAGDPKEVIDTNDITVSTLGKAGTALDIPGLIQVLMTVALSEPKANLQAKGRNRDLSSKPGFEGITPKFFYFVGTDLPKHWQYHKEKETLFKDRTLAIQSINTPYVIGEPMDRYLSYQGNKDNGF